MFLALLVVGEHRLGGVDVEARVLPREQQFLGITAQAPGLAQAAQHHPPEELRQRPEVPPLDTLELALAV
jgi:hypothetical protein